MGTPRSRLVRLVLAALTAPLVLTQSDAGAASARAIDFPVLGSVSFVNTFGAPRPGGRTHEGIDIFGRKMQPLVAAVDGWVHFVAYPQPSWGYAVAIVDTDGWHYWYIHLNNDNPGTDDGLGSGMWAYAPDMEEGRRVVKGQLIGWMGDSGNAEPTPPHLHFEIRRPDDTPINPYESLLGAPRRSSAASYPRHPDEVLPYGGFKGGASLALGSFDADEDQEFVTGAGPGGGPNVKVLELSGTARKTFYAYGASFEGGVDVAAGDVNGDGRDEIITAPGPGGRPYVRVFSPGGTPLGGFMAYGTSFKGGVFVGAGDLDGDGKDEIVTGPRRGGRPHVRAFRSDGTAVASFMAYTPTFKGGVDVDAGDLLTLNGETTATLRDEIVTGAGPGAGPHVKVLDRSGVLLNHFMAFDRGFRGGVRVSVGDVRPFRGQGEIATIPASLGSPRLRLYTPGGGSLGWAYAFEDWWRGSYDVAAGSGLTRGATGLPAESVRRRASVREGAS